MVGHLRGHRGERITAIYGRTRIRGKDWRVDRSDMGRDVAVWTCFKGGGFFGEVDVFVDGRGLLR